jgi:signal transduction histidine kinase
MNLLDLSETDAPQEQLYGNELLKKANSSLTKIYKEMYRQKNEGEIQTQTFKRFMSQFIHAMKTPVTIIDLAVQKAQGNIASDGKACRDCELIKDISAENKRQKEMLDNLLEYLRLEEFSRDYIPESVDLLDELNNIINSRKRSFIYNSVLPNTSNIADQRFMVLTDKKWNRVLIDQIISNAIKYSAAGEQMKNIDFCIENEGKQTKLIIKDHGIGIPAHDLPKITEPFFTGENGRTQKNATGIGLYIVKLIAEKLGHELEIQSETGRGTSVIISYLTKM